MLRHSLVFGLLLASSATLKADFEGVLDERLHDFGVVPRGQQLTHYFRVNNPTNKTLHITNVRVSCGCTSARALETTIPPGRDTAVYAVMDSRRFVGSKQVTIYVTFDQPRFEELRTVVQANAREDLIFGPDTINFGKVKHGDAKSATMNITIYNGAVQILEAKSESNYVQPTLKEIRRSGNETTYQVEAKVRPDTPVGLWFTDVWVKTNNPGYAKLRVPVTVEVEGLQPAKTEEKKIDATKTSRNSESNDDDATIPNQTQTDEPPYQTAPVFVQPTAERAPYFPWISSFFRR
jgi:hypothetical protein